MTTTDEFTVPDADDVEPVDATTDTVAETPEVDEPPAEEHSDDDKPGSKREAKYRVQLRETEAERDQLRATVEALQRSEVERIAGQSIQRPAALWSTDVELSSLLDDAGRVDPFKVNAATKQATETLGLAAKRPAGYVGGEGRTIGSPGAADPWQAAFK